MDTAPTLTIWQRLFDASRPGVGPADAHRFLHRRVRLYVGSLLVFFGLFLLIGLGKTAWVVLSSNDAVRVEGWQRALRVGNLTILSVAVLLAAAWIYLRRRMPSVVGLHLIESLGTVVWSGVLANMVRALPTGAPQGTVVLILVLMLVVRAAIVPSRPAVTVVVGLVGTVALTIAIYRDHLGEDPTADPFGAYMWVMPLAWGLVFSTATAFVSRVIYGLQQSVRQAMQLGNYTLVAKLGEGGMGEVYMAQHALLRRPTAIKLLPPDKVGERAVARFEREVQQTSRLNHPNTVAIFDYGRTPEGIFYYAMEYLDGVNLDELVELDGPQPAGRVIRVLEQVAHALAEAHEAGLIHRDIKPANVVLCSRGGVPDMAKVVDFGLVKDLKSPDPTLSTAELVAGTPTYMAPEVLTAPDEVDGRVDLYALGAVGYFLLTGQDVFEGRTVVEICGHHLHSVPVPPSERLGSPIADDLEAVILRALAKEPDARFESAAAMRAALLACRDASRWGEREAARWWSAHGDAVARLRETERHEIASGTRATVMVAARSPEDRAA